jgi:hypothetical protein
MKREESRRGQARTETYTFGDPLTIKVGEEVDVMEILEKQWAVGRRSLGGIWLRDGCTVGGLRR